MPIVAYNYGAKNRARMIQAVKIAALSSPAACMFVGMLLFLDHPGNASVAVRRV